MAKSTPFVVTQAATTTPPADGAAAGTPPGTGAEGAPDGAPKTVKARVLVAGNYGKPDTVVTVTEAAAAASSELDSHPDAVAYVESLASGGSA